MNISMEEAIKLGSLALGSVILLVSVGLWLYVRNSDRHEKIDARFSELARELGARLEKTLERLVALERHAAKTIDHDHLGEVYERVNILDRGIAEIKGSVDAMRSSFNQLMNEIIKRGM